MIDVRKAGIIAVALIAGIIFFVEPFPGLSLQGNRTIGITLTIFHGDIPPWPFLPPFLIPLNRQFGLHPVLISMAFIAAGNSLFMSYHQPFILMSDTLTKSRAWSEGQVSIADLLYAMSIIVGIFVSSFYWKTMGLMQ